MDKKYQVFISSTYLDLIPEREKARDVILSMYHFPIGMEMFSAADEEQWERRKQELLQGEDLPDVLYRGDLPVRFLHPAHPF